MQNYHGKIRGKIMAGYRCRVCYELMVDGSIEHDEYGELTFWSCKKCGCDRIGCWYLEKAGLNIIEVHQKLNGRPSYKGVNMDTVELVINTFKTNNEQN